MLINITFEHNNAAFKSCPLQLNRVSDLFHYRVTERQHREMGSINIATYAGANL